MNAFKTTFLKPLAVLSFIMLLIAMLSITWSTLAHGAESPALEVPVSVNALMVTLIDHSAHYLWDYGAMERDITDDEWRTVEYYAIQLAASGPLITMGGSGMLDDAWAASPLWTEYARQMSNAAMLALNATEMQDKGLLASVGDVLVSSCEGCHAAFKPGLPTEGYTHMPDYDYLYHLFR